MRWQRVLQAGAIYFGALVVFVFAAGPVVLALLGSIIPDQALLSFPPQWFSKGFTLDNYRYVFTGQIPTSYEVAGANRAMISEAARQVPASMLNSFVVALSVMAINIVAGGMAAYAFARMRFRGKKITFMGIILCRLVPAAALTVPFYLVVQAIGLLGTKVAIVMVHSLLTLPFTVLILSVFFRRVPQEIEESAAVDGCNRLQAFYLVTLPLSAPSLVATGLFAFMLSYSEFLYSLVLSGEAEDRMLSVVMAALARNTDVSWGLLQTGIFLALVPSVVLVAVVWRFVVQGIVMGAVKQ